MDEPSKMHHFKSGLKPEVKLHLIGLHPAPNTLAELMKAATDYDDALFRLKATTARPSSTHGSNPTYIPKPTTNLAIAPTPMEIDSQTIKHVTTTGKLSQTEKEHCKSLGLCLYDGLADCKGVKDINECPNIKKRNAGNAPSRAASRN